MGVLKRHDLRGRAAGASVAGFHGAIIMTLIAFRSQDDAGLLRTAETAFVWQRSEDGWTDIVELLAAMEDGACISTSGAHGMTCK